MPEKVWMQGPPGAATVTVGTVTTGEPGTDAIVINSGTESAAVLNFTIPKGETGAVGAVGPQGPKGDKGDPGPAGAGVPDGGTVGQLLGKTETGTAWIDPPQSGVQPDWNQNDSTAADYVKNRPFYTGNPVETVLVEESTVTFAENRGLYAAKVQSTFEATVGETYKVSWDGTTYECACVDRNGTSVVGNISILGAGPDTGEPFVMGINGVAIQILTADTSASHTFSISGFVSEVVKIDSKYFPLFNPNNNYVSGLPTPNQIYDFGKSFKAIIGQTTISQLENKKAVFDYVFYDSTMLLRLRPFSVTKQDGTVTIEYTGVDTQKMRVCALEFSFNGSADDSVLTNVNIKYPSAMYVNSSTSGSTKQFKITVDDTGALKATEVT